jgi:hypothetical protein
MTSRPPGIRVMSTMCNTLLATAFWLLSASMSNLYAANESPLDKGI